MKNKLLQEKPSPCKLRGSTCAHSHRGCPGRLAQLSRTLKIKWGARQILQPLKWGKTNTAVGPTRVHSKATPLISVLPDLAATLIVSERASISALGWGSHQSKEGVQLFPCPNTTSPVSFSTPTPGVCGQVLAVGWLQGSFGEESRGCPTPDTACSRWLQPAWHRAQLSPLAKVVVPRGKQV